MANRQPFSFEPMLCQWAERPPEGPEWRYELKLDGFRAIGRKSGRSAQLWSRILPDSTRRFPGVVKGITELSHDTIIDGEVVALDENGKPSFNLLQGFGDARAIVLYAFDLLMLEGKDVRMWPLDDRREQLREIVSTLTDTIRYSETFKVPLRELMRAVREHQLEGIVAKRADSHYRSGERSGEWVKWRANRSQEFVIGGYIANGDILDSLLVGYYEGRHLMYASSIHQSSIAKRPRYSRGFRDSPVDARTRNSARSAATGLTLSPSRHSWRPKCRRAAWK
jgi:ATP-dependent DNA ligase